MKISDDGRHMTLSTGREIYANGNIIGLDLKPHPSSSRVREGYDGSVETCLDEEYWNMDEEDHARRLNPDECIELADHMITAWMKFKAEAEAKKCEPEQKQQP